MKHRWVALTLAFAAMACGSSPPATKTVTASAVNARPAPGAMWLDHMKKDLLPFWMHPDAFGEPVGNFPSVRCNDGKKLDRANPCPEIKGEEWLLMNQQYVVALSRQTYGYGVAFHVTGDPKYLELAKAGVNYLRAHALDPKGGAYTMFNGKTQAWGPEPSERNPQELAYAALGISFYYYLTRDKSVLADVVKHKDYVLKNFYDKDLNALRWQLGDGTNAKDKKLTAQLDQLNAYMLLIAPLLDGETRKSWNDDMRKLVTILRSEFYSEKENLFFLRANTRDEVNSANAETDLGHTIKSLWMMRFVGRELGDTELVKFAEERGLEVLKHAFLPATGSWARGIKKGGTLDETKEWWIYDELDQFAATMTLTPKREIVRQYLGRTYPYFLEHFVDRQFGETWSYLEADGSRKQGLPKAWPWKSQYHNMEHALVAYITEQGSRNLPVSLYFAFDRTPDTAQIRPYFYSGRVLRLETHRPGVQRAEFTAIQ